MGALNVLLFIMIVSFVVDRVARAMLFVMSFLGRWIAWLGDVSTISDPATRAVASRRQQLAYSIVAATFAAVFVWQYEEVRLLKILLEEPPDATLDMFVTWMTVLGGSDFVGRLLAVSGAGNMGAGPSSATQPIEITGTLTLENPERAPQAPPGDQER